MKKIAILGSTGSIGTQTLEIVRNNQDFSVCALAASKSVNLMEKQIREFKPKIAALYDENAAKDLAQRVKDLPVKVLHGMDGLIAVAAFEESEMLVTGIVGMIGIRPTIAAIEAGKTIALANKETLVTAGHLIMPLAAKKGVSILPVDSEHSAIFQSMNGERENKIKKILLTASGGPFRGKTKEELSQMTLEDALKHPNWSMGPKVTIDSASLVNKGLEVMEAKWLFDVSLKQIQVVVHPQSIVHSMVEYEDGAVMAQLGIPDMKLPIQYALTYPKRRTLYQKELDLFQIKNLSFEEPDMKTFRGLALAYKAAEIGGSLPTVFNAANEMAVKLLLNHKIHFLEIPSIIEEAMDAHCVKKNPSLQEVLDTEKETYDYILMNHNSF